MKKLKKSPVVFNEDEHTYELKGNALSGITPIVGWMFPMTYSGISEEVLQRAAEYGHDIHRRCNLLDLYGIVDDHESVKDYIQLKQENGLKAIDCEYLVSDKKRVASSIDVLFVDNEKNLVLGDIKTTSQIHVENVSLQLSIYAYLFEKQNPGLVASRLVVIWLPKPQYGRAKIMECKRIPDELCERIIAAYSNNDDPSELRMELYNALGFQITAADEVLPENLRDVEAEVARIERTMKEMKERSETLKAGLLKLMQEYKKDKWEGDLIILSRRSSSIRRTLDTAKVKAEYPDVYKACIKETETSESLTIKIK